MPFHLSLDLTFNQLTLTLQTALAYARIWHHADAKDRVLGQLAGRIAIVLMGKHKPIYDPSGMFSWFPFPVGM